MLRRFMLCVRMLCAARAAAGFRFANGKMRRVLGQTTMDTMMDAIR
jgi:hypothetical protein